MISAAIERVEVGGVRTDVVARLDALLAGWDLGDRFTAHAEVEGFWATVRDEVGDGQKFLDEEAYHPDTLAERLEPVIDWCEEHPSLPYEEIRFAREALENAQRCYRVLEHIVSNLNDPKVLDCIERAVGLLTPREEE